MASKLMQQFGMSASEATGEVARLALAGREAGVGVLSYMNEVMTAAGGMRMLGGTLTDARLMAESLRESLERQGLKDHMAGAVALMTTGQAAAGFAQMSKGLLTVIAREMGLGTDAAAYLALRDLFMDPERGPGAALTAMTKFMDLIKNSREMSQEEMALTLETLVPGLSSTAAMTMVKNLEVLKDAASSKEDRLKAEREFKDSFTRERSRTEDWRVNFKDGMLGLAKMGSALFSMMTTGLAEIVIFMRRLPFSFDKWARDLGLAPKWEIGRAHV